MRLKRALPARLARGRGFAWAPGPRAKKGAGPAEGTRARQGPRTVREERRGRPAEMRASHGTKTINESSGARPGTRASHGQPHLLNANTKRP